VTAATAAFLAAAAAAANPEEIELGDEDDDDDGNADNEAAAAAAADGVEGEPELQQKAVPAGVFGELAGQAEAGEQQQGEQLGALERFKKRRVE
jgi:hypothetical protein